MEKSTELTLILVVVAFLFLVCVVYFIGVAYKKNQTFKVDKNEAEPTAVSVFSETETNSNFMSKQSRR